MILLRFRGSSMKAVKHQKQRAAAQISWEQIVANLEDGVVTVDPEGKIVFFNEAAEVLTDVSSVQATEQPFRQVFKSAPWLIDLAHKTAAPRHEGGRGEGA